MNNDNCYALFFITDSFGTLKLFTDYSCRKDTETKVERFLELMRSSPDEHDAILKAFILPYKMEGKIEESECMNPNFEE